MASKPTLLIDTDVLCHQFAYRNTTSLNFGDEDGEGGEAVDFHRPEKAKVEVEGYIESLREELNADRVILALSCRQVNFRKQLDPTYKGNRTQPKPDLWYVIRDHVESNAINHTTITYSRLEGDDVLGMLHTGPYKGRSIMVSIDKDMKTIPGLLYNPNKPDLGVVPISRPAAHRFHLYQTLVGDTTDNYKGLKGCGPVNAEKILGDTEDPVQMWKAVVAAYEAKGLTEADAIHQARLAYILWDGNYNTSTMKIKLWNPSYLSA